ncbi:hypothetical protein GCM10022268_27050 [Sphingomonas cynarae]|uniref:DUF4893 domain-containing protein n=1 Tax=Sphingomonas cynarae TaxID=930197 RepID=A0ABP7ECK3_9SPHN
MKRIIGLALLTVPVLAGCAARDRPAAMGGTAVAEAATVEMKPVSGWRAMIRPDDAMRIDTLPARWAAARAGVGRRGAAALRGEGDLLRADAGLAHPALPPGSYRCRSVTLARGLVQAGKPFFCYVGGETGERVSFTKQTGTALPGGWLYPERDRYIFLGARQRRAGDVSLGYGVDATRDLIGVMERIGAFRWRLVLAGNMMEVYELTPVAPDQQGAGAN